MRPRRVVIGRIVRAHGVRGEMRVDLITDHEDRFASLRQVWLTRDGNDLGQFEIERWRSLGKAIGLKLRGVDAPEAVVVLRGAEIEAEPLPPGSLPDDTYYIFDLIGLEVESDDGRSLGTVSEVLQLPANDVLVVRQEKSELMLPLISSVVKKVDLERGVITAHLLPGLLDL